MGRWSQARRRGGGGELPPPSWPCNPPEAEDWLLEEDSGNILASIGVSFPEGSDAWRTRNRVVGLEDWDLSNTTSAGTITVWADYGEEELEVQAQFMDETSGSPVSDWSATKTYPN